MIPEGTAQEAYPCWEFIADGYAACAPDTLRWFDFAYQKAILHDDRGAEYTQKWTNSLNALRWSTVKGKMMRSDQTVFYHGEILTTLGLLYENSSLLPAGIDPALIKQRICESALWFQTVGIRTISTSV